jgi:hypothetical protein
MVITVIEPEKSREKKTQNQPRVSRENLESGVPRG